VIAFQRVKLDDVKFADERLQDNSYWAKVLAVRSYMFEVYAGRNLNISQ
jgi:hypothetical protein